MNLGLNEEVDTLLEVKEPVNYKVILHNDDETEADFVITVLMQIFHKTKTEAKKLMVKIHEEGQAICGLYPHEIAQTKADQVRIIAQRKKYPLLATIEED